jgi:hypothetical protein
MGNSRLMPFLEADLRRVPRLSQRVVTNIRQRQGILDTSVVGDEASFYDPVSPASAGRTLTMQT